MEGRYDTEKRLKNLVASRFDIIDKLGKTYYERENTPSQQAAMFQEVRRIITDFSENNEMFQELEQMVNTCHDNAMQKLRQFFPAMKENDIRLLCYIFTGFSPQVISLFMKESVANIYARKSRLKSRIKLPEHLIRSCSCPSSDNCQTHVRKRQIFRRLICCKTSI